MFNILRIITKISYMLIATIILIRIVLKVFCLEQHLIFLSLIIQPIYFITNLLIGPISFILNIISGFLPPFIHKFFPLIKIGTTNGTFEWAALISVLVYLLLGILLEQLFQMIYEYERAFLSVAKESTATAQLKRKEDKLKRIKEESIMVSKQYENNENALRAVYNIIIKRLDREKTELVNKNISLEKELITDTLTGLRTRKYLNDRIKYEFNAAKTRKGTLSIIMVDIDHFKKINDTFGHKYGDIVLKEVSRIIMNNCHGNIVAARYGGEEITIICPKLSLDETYKFADTIRTRVEKELKNSLKENTHITISAGVATFSDSNIAESPEQLIEYADTALYEAKFSGRNCVKAYIN